jgi:hypothetical protein
MAIHDQCFHAWAESVISVADRSKSLFLSVQYREDIKWTACALRPDVHGLPPGAHVQSGMLDVDDESLRRLQQFGPVTRSLEDLDPQTRGVHLRRDTRRLDLLERFPDLRAIWALGLRQEELECVCKARSVTHFVAQACTFGDLLPLRQLTRLKALFLSYNTKATSLEGLEALGQLEILSLASFTKRFSLEPLRPLSGLRYLWLSGTMWTAMRVDSLEPLSALSRLERLKLSNVRVGDRRLDALLGLSQLTEIELPDVFSHEDFMRLRRSFPTADAAAQPRVRRS